MGLTIQPLTLGSGLWERVARYAGGCSWRAGGSLAEAMQKNGFRGWERVFAALDDAGQIAGYCTLTEKDCLPQLPYTPYIGYVFVGEPYRGERLSGLLLEAAMQYAESLGFHSVYLISDHRGLYEKYGFIRVDERPAPWNPETVETVFMHSL